MPLEPGQALSHYRLIEQIGAGGMGIVWRAVDTNLDREVAIKVLPDQFTRDPDRLSRFEREAKLLAAVSHPSIATVHGLDEDGDTRLIAMEFVPGESLAQRLSRGPSPLDEGLELARQVADALEAAHERGVIHRDLKPANIRVTPDGTAKVLDFGLAKTVGTPADGDASSAPTVTSGGSSPGVILGTATYMSPEQARGRPLDRRTDIWSFGCVLYETLCGTPCFAGETVTDVLARVLEREPDWEALPNNTPVAIRRLLRRCLDKDPRQRLRDIGEARIAIEGRHMEPAARGASASRGARFTMLPWILAAAMTVCAAVAGWLAFRAEPGAPQDPVRLVVNLPRDEQLAIANEASLAISPDGRRIVYGAASPPGSRPRLFLRDLTRFEAEAIPGTEGAIGPFFSPDGRWLGYFLEGKLFRISVEGGTPIEVCHVGQVVPGACWTENDTILYTDSPDSGLLRVPAGGGTPQRLTTPAAADGEIGHGWPSRLPDGRNIVFTVSNEKGSNIAVLSLDTGEWRSLEPGLGGARYSPSGHLIFARHEGLMAVPFDPVTLRTKDTPVVVHDDVYTIPALTGFGMAVFDVSRTGALVYLPGGSAAGENRLVWVDRDGRARPASRDPGLYEWPRLSPDGTKLAVNDAKYDGTGNIWILDLERDARSKLTREDNNLLATWTPDGKRLAFGSLRPGSGVVNVFWKAADASDETTRLLESVHPRFPRSFSPDGRWLAIVEWNPESMRDLWILDLHGSGGALPFVSTPSDEHSPYFSPDGRWLAYVSDESGRCEVYVNSYPRGDGRWIISAGGGKEPVWSTDGSELFYRNVDAMMVVSIESEPAFSASAPRVLFERNMKSGVYDTVSYDVAVDGSEFLMIERNLELAPDQINVVLHWDQELRNRSTSRD